MAYDGSAESESWARKRQSLGLDTLTVVADSNCRYDNDDPSLSSPMPFSDSSILESPHTPSSTDRDMISIVDLTPSRDVVAPKQPVDSKSLQQEHHHHQPDQQPPPTIRLIKQCKLTLDDSSSWSQVGYGSFCKVYRAHATRRALTTGRADNLLVAIKTPRSHKLHSTASNPDDKFHLEPHATYLLNQYGDLDPILRNEALILSRLPQQSSIIHFHGLGPTDMLVFDYYTSNLTSHLETITPVHTSQPFIGRSSWKSFALRLLDALDFLKSNNIVHCDIKPDNILLDDDGAPVLADFSSAQDLSPIITFPHQPGNSAPYSAASAIEFTAPELLSNKSLPSFSTDCYSLGLVMLVAGTGNPPYHMAHKNFMQKLMWAQSGAVLDTGSAEDALHLSEISDILKLWLNTRSSLSDLKLLVESIPL